MPNPRDIVTAERVIPAPAAAIFDVLADPARHPEIDGSGSVKRARPGSAARLSNGATFGMDMPRGVHYGMVSTVTEFDEGRRIAWAPKPASGRGARLAGRIWRYELEPVDGVEAAAVLGHLDTLGEPVVGDGAVPFVERDA